MKTIFVLLVFVLVSFQLVSQTNASYYEFCEQSTQISNTGMFVLGSWAIGNMAIGAFGWSKNEGAAMYFSQMNVFWNVVNLSIAGVSLYTNLNLDCTTLSSSEFLQQHLKTERILKLNALLDIGYIGTGFLLKHLSTSSSARMDLLKGYGNSLILQGGFLLTFDAILFLLLKNERTIFDSKLSLSMLNEIPGLCLTLRF